ncbi:MAG: protein-export chaperone SecB [Proteobacteria bacterium]|nr:protein-export chaperone SecB [Pseudomonadota bacterium]
MSEEKAPQGPVLSMERVYVRDVSFESPNSPMVFLSQEAPEINIQLNIGHRKLESDDYYEVVLNVNVNAKVGETTAFLVELQQAGLFMIKDVPEDEMEKVLEIACPNILLPFAREAINDHVGKGGFPQLLLNPVNFEALYAQKLSAQKQPAEAKH